MKQEPIIRPTYFDEAYYRGLEAAVPQERRFSRRRRFHLLVWLAVVLALGLLAFQWAYRGGLERGL